MTERDGVGESGVSRRVRDASPRGRDLVARLARAGIEAKLFGQPLQTITVGRYEILDELGTGGMGVVYLARDPQLDREVALKLLRPAGTTRHDPEHARARLVREARAMARLSHPNVLTVHEVGTFEDQVFVAMEYVHGRTLAQWLAERERAWREVLEAFIAAGRGLAAAHAKGIVHRDFKPENVMVSALGRVLVLDFGLARNAASPAPEATPALPTADAIASLTLTGALVGTPAYMAPELYAARAADPKSDQFAFCVALWEAVYRQRPFLGSTLTALAQSVLAGDIVEPIGIGARPAWLRRALERGLMVDPGQRHPSMDALLSALEDGLRPRWHERWMPAAVGGLALAVGVALMATASRPRISPPALEIAATLAAREQPPATMAAPPRAEPEPEPDHSLHAPQPEPAPTPERDTPAAIAIAPAEPHHPAIGSRTRTRRPAYRHAWCYVREDIYNKVRSPTPRLHPEFRDDDTCWSCRPHDDPDNLRARIDQTDCEHYAVCQHAPCK